MAALKSVKKVRPDHWHLVGVITSRSALRQALAMRYPPDLFELRLDHLWHCEKELQRQLPSLGVPLIITARDAREGGVHNLSVEARHQLLMRYIDHARYIDIELQSARALAAVLKAAGNKNKSRILSFHDFCSTPAPPLLWAKAKLAQALGADVFKVATKTDTSEAVARLITFVLEAKGIIDVSVMGMGRFGLSSRVALAKAGSKLIYGSVGRGRIKGQPSLVELRSALPASATRII